MIYNQKQRQLIIWEQGNAMNIVRSFTLMIDLGLRLLVRNSLKHSPRTSELRLKEQQVFVMDRQMIH